MLQFLKHLHDAGYLEQLARTGGVPLLMAIIFAETGLLVGFFLPGDTLLFVAGTLAALTGPSGQTYLPITLLLPGLIVAAIAGDQVGYWLGFQTGRSIFTRDDGFFFRKKHLVSAHNFYMKYGPWAVIGARFAPVLRTFVPFVAGVGQMPYRRFLFIDTIGGILWIGLVVGSGYLLGARAQHQMHLIVPAIALVSMLPVAIGLGRAFLGRFTASSVSISK